MSLRDDERAAVLDPTRALLAVLGALTVVAPLVFLTVSVVLQRDAARRLAASTVAAILGWQVVVVALAATNSLLGLLALAAPAALAAWDVRRSSPDRRGLVAGIYGSPGVLFATLAVLFAVT